MAKKNKSYWQNRQEHWLNTQDKDDERISNRLEKEYQRTAKELEKDISTYFNRYGHDNVIEFRTMLQDLSDEDRNLLFQDMDRFAEKYPQYTDLMPVRQSVYQLNRLEGLHYSTQMKLLELGAIEQEELLKHLEKTYGKHYQNMLKELGIGNQFLSIDDMTMRNTLFQGWVNGENFSDRIWSNKEKMLEHMQTVYRDGLARGDSYAKLTKAIRERFDVGASDAKRLVWTESTFVLNQAHTQAYRNAGVEEYEISAIRDSKTSPICRDMDGKVFRFDEMEVGLNFPPFHPYCRTTFIGLIDGLLGEAQLFENAQNPDLTSQFVAAKGDRKKFAEDVLASYGIDVPVEISETNARGYNRFANFGEGNEADIMNFVLQADDDRSIEYQFKTVLHEAYHSKLKGLEVPISGDFDINKWTLIEETMTELSAHYQMSLLSDKSLMPAYGDYLSVNLPRMKKITEFESYTDFFDFGKKALEYRFDENKRTADWRQLYRELNEVEFDFNQYVRDNYIEELKSQKDVVLDMIYQNSPSFREHHELIKKDYDGFVKHIEKGMGILVGNEEMIGKQAVTALYRLVGVKSWK